MSQNIYLDFNHKNSTCHYETEQGLIVNLQALIYDKSELKNIINLPNKFRDLVFVNSYEMLYQGFRKFLLDGKVLSYVEHAQFRQVLVEVYSHFAVLKTQPYIPAPSKTYDGTETSALRCGIVELRVLENFLYSPEKLEQAFSLVFAKIKANDFSIKDMDHNETLWLSVDDIYFNLQTFMTNAGYYVNLDERQAFKELVNWCELYLKAIKDNTLLVCPALHPFFIPTLQYLYKATNQLCQHITFSDTLDFYETIKGKRVLFITPLADLISKQFSSGNIFKLYNNYHMPKFELTTINMPLSFYPSRPGTSWLDTYQKCCEEISTYLSNEKFDLFTASAGCYGLPLCDYAYKNHSVKILYYGNHMNTLFGISQQCSNNFMPDIINKEAWIAGDLVERCPQVRDIDDGRYI